MEVEDVETKGKAGLDEVDDEVAEGATEDNAEGKTEGTILLWLVYLFSLVLSSHVFSCLIT